MDGIVQTDLKFASCNNLAGRVVQNSPILSSSINQGIPVLGTGLGWLGLSGRWQVETREDFHDVHEYGACEAWPGPGTPAVTCRGISWHLGAPGHRSLARQPSHGGWRRAAGATEECRLAASPICQGDEKVWDGDLVDYHQFWSQIVMVMLTTREARHDDCDG